MDTAVRSQTPAPKLSSDVLNLDLQFISLDRLVESPHNPRQRFDEGKLDELAASLERKQLTPINVRPMAGERFEIGAGHRRYRAAKKKGLTGLLAIVQQMSDVEFYELLVFENGQRDDLTPLEEARGYRTLMERASYTVQKIADREGLSKQYVYDSLSLLQLVPEAKKYLEDGVISRQHAIEIARLLPAEQKMVIGKPNGYDSGGLFEHEDAHSAEQGSLPLKLGVKVRSVRELKSFINEEIRFRPEHNDLPNLFPAAAVVLEELKKDDQELPPVFITYQHVISEGAKDGKQRTFTRVSWRRADGKPDPEHGVKQSKTCTWSRWGIVAAGQNRGDAFRVCVNRDKCETHFGAAKAKLKRDRARFGMGSSGSSEKRRNTEAGSAAPIVYQPDHDLEEKWYDEAVADLAKRGYLGEIKKLISQIKLPDLIVWNLACSYIEWNSWSPVGKRLYSGSYGTNFDQHLRTAILPQLPGKWTKNVGADGAFTNAVAARSFLAFDIWQNQNGAAIDKAIRAAFQVRNEAWVVEQKATAKAKAAEKKKPAKKQAKKGAH